MQSEDERSLAIDLLNKYGGEVDDYFKLWPPDKQYFFSADGETFLAYGVRYKVAACLFDPIGKRNSVGRLLKEFKEFCDYQNLHIIFIQTTNKYDKEYKSIGLHRLIIGSDALINIEEFMSVTVKNKYFRNIVNRFSKSNYHVETALPPHSNKLIREIRDISEDWIKLPNHKEWNFLTGRFTRDYLKDLPIYILRDKDNEALAFANGLPSYRKKAATIDLIRRRRDSPPNAIDYLFIEIMRSLNNHNGTSYFNIGISPIDGSYFASSLVEKGLIGLYKSSSKFIGFKGLHQFKAKYQPEWEPRYVYFSNGVPSLVRKGIAILKLML